ncbi:MAG: RnfABCDGE type electron transport complex subunit G, partial [Verrucomicrobiota bacterium]
MKEVLKLSFSLGLICLLAATVLSFAYFKTKDRQEAAAMEEQARALRKVLPEFTNQPFDDNVIIELEKEEDVDVEFYRARKDGQINAVAGQTESGGYGGAVTVLVGLSLDGEIRKIVVTDHQETPGLGTKATEREAARTIVDILSEDRGDQTGEKTSLPPNPYLDQYEDYNVTEKQRFKLTQSGGDIDAVSGATVTSDAISDAVSQIANAFK